MNHLSNTATAAHLSDPYPDRSPVGKPEPQLGQQEQPLAHLKILLVEDNLINQKITVRQLKNLGCIADTAMHGLEAVAAVLQQSYDIVLMDCQMPLLDGYGATEQIRALERQELSHRQPSIIIAITANILNEDRERAIAAGMNDYLSKPVNQKMLAATLEHWSQAASSHSRSVSSTTESLELQHIDWSYLHRLSDNSTEFEWELLRVFVGDSHSYLNLLKQALAAQDYEQIEYSAHHLHGASANIGATVMRAAAEQLERQARLQQVENGDRLLQVLETSLAQIQQLVERQGT